MAVAQSGWVLWVCYTVGGGIRGLCFLQSLSQDHFCRVQDQGFWSLCPEIVQFRGWVLLGGRGGCFAQLTHKQMSHKAEQSNKSQLNEAIY